MDTTNVYLNKNLYSHHGDDGFGLRQGQDDADTGTWRR